MGYLKGVHVRMVRRLYLPKWAFQEEFTTECCDNFIVQQEPFIQGEYTWHSFHDSYSIIGYSGRVHVIMLWWFHSARWLFQEEFTWECCDGSIVQHRLFERVSCENATPIEFSKMSNSGGVHKRMLWGFHSLTLAIHSGGVHVRMLWWFHSATWVIQGHITL
jgi:hypothetical protein